MMFSLVDMAIAGVGLVMSLAASGYVKYKFNQGKQVTLRSGQTGADIARAILRHNDVNDVQVLEHQGFLSDHYSPTEKTLNLSPDVYNGRTAAAAGVAAHEVGHALQHAQGDLSMWGRTILVYPAHFGSMLGPVLVGIGFFMAGARGLVQGSLAHTIALIGLYGFGAAVLCSTIIVFNEFNASKRAKLSLISMGITRPGEEDDAVKGVLLAAGLTYLAAALTAALHFAYYAYLIFGGRRNED